MISSMKMFAENAHRYVSEDFVDVYWTSENVSEIIKFKDTFFKLVTHNFVTDYTLTFLSNMLTVQSYMT